MINDGRSTNLAIEIQKLKSMQYVAAQASALKRKLSTMMIGGIPRGLPWPYKGDLLGSGEFLKDRIDGGGGFVCGPWRSLMDRLPTVLRCFYVVVFCVSWA